ncbi:MAG: DUF1800 domain-containing protein [Saprospiraceae bacterium]|nr:DUF1800 domain-containing protein [Saprospiraceae bacterium]
MPLTPYSGTFGKPELLHLLRRTLFGVKKSDLQYFSNRSLSSVANELLTLPNTPPAPPLKDYTGTDVILAGETWVNGPSDGNVQFSRQQSLRGWWMGLIVNQDRNIREKMVLFLHNLIPTDIGGTFSEAIYSYRYNALLRQYALGNYKTLVRQMTIEPAMLYYLDGRLNRNTAPNENYARELQELFTVGKDSTPYYTEGDVQTAAKVLTGWEIDSTNLTSKFTLSRHTTTNKTFSSFYNNTVIVGRNDANAGLTELDDLLTMIFSKEEVAKYIVRKIYRFFVYYNIDATIESEVITPLAATFRNGNYELAPVMLELLTSQHFFDAAKSQGCMIKNPVDSIAGLARIFGLTYTTAPDLVNQYKNWRYFLDSGTNQQMRIGNPPNVAGWTAYYQAPSYHELWINAETLRRKKEYSDKLITSNNNGMSFDILGFTASMVNPSDPNELIDEVSELMHVVAIDTTIKAQLKSILLSNQALDSYWTAAWDNYVSAPSNTTYRNTVLTRLKTFYQAVVSMAEFHLC